MATAAEKRKFLIDRLDELPTLPTVIYELDRIISDPMSSTKEVEKVMENDQSLTAKVLKLANSAYYAIPGGVSSVARAIAYLGYDTIHQLALSSSIINAIEVKGPSDFDMNEFWKHSIGVAIGAETIAKTVGHPVPSDLFTCGLVHDIGKVALFTVDAQQMLAIRDFAESKDLSYFEAEKLDDEVIPHTELGRILTERWNLPVLIQSVVRSHHELDVRKRGGISADIQRAVDIVMLSNILIHALKFGYSGHKKIPGAPKELLSRLVLSPSGLKKLIAEIQGSLGRATEFIHLIGHQ